MDIDLIYPHQEVLEKKCINHIILLVTVRRSTPATPKELAQINSQESVPTTVWDIPSLQESNRFFWAGSGSGSGSGG